MKTMTEIEKEFDDEFPLLVHNKIRNEQLDVKQFYRQQIEQVLKEIVPEKRLMKCTQWADTCELVAHYLEIKQNISNFMGK